MVMMAVLSCLPQCGGDDRPVVEVRAGEPVPVVSDSIRVDLRYDEVNMGPEWGGDTSVQWAVDDCLAYGGEPIWHNGPSYFLICEDIDA